tara:strand:+ start:2737 stop:4164 length:1428 start_codon:yes stop_codon:yes gene_type:complete
MSFTTVPINITGPSYQSRSKPLSSQQTKNWYQQIAESGKEQFVLMPFPGLKLSGSSGLVLADRGFHRMSEILYQVKGTVLYEIASNGTHTSRGVILGTKRCIMAGDGINLFIVVPNEKVWQYSTATNLITEVTNVNITGAQSVDFINNQFLYTFPDFTVVSDVGNGASASGLNIIAEETLPDKMVRDFVYEEVIYRCGVRSIVAWYNSGVGSPPIEKLQGRIFSIGLAALHSIAKTDEAFYWLGDDNSIYQARGGDKEKVSTDAISNSIREFSVTSDAIGYTYTMQGQNFYTITFPTANKTFTINESLGKDGWFELSSGTVGDKWQATSVISAYGQNYAADEFNGNVYTLDLDTYTNNGEPLQRTRVTASINGDLLGAKGKRTQMSRLELIMETGVGLVSGQGDNPRIMIEASYDGGRSWSHGAWARTGRLGEFVIKVEWFSLRTFLDMMIRVSTTDPVNYSIYSGTIDLRLAGK